MLIALLAAMPVFHPSSPHAGAISGLFLLVLAVCGGILLIVAGMVGISLIRFRHRPGAGEPRQYFGNRKLEIVWTVGPILILVWLFVLAARGMQQSDPTANRAPDLLIIAHQWWWEVRYPRGGAVTANEIHIPAGAKWLVKLDSADVIHDFWVPELAPKMDVVPGHTNFMWLEASNAGKYDGTCAEFCGCQHAWMRFTVIAESQASFDAWLNDETKPAAAPVGELAQRGLKTFQTMSCINCHSIGGVSEAAKAAPDLTHIASRKMLGGGVLSNTDANLHAWLQDPQAIKPGCFMPNLKLTDDQVDALVSYLGNLK